MFKILSKSDRVRCRWKLLCRYASSLLLDQSLEGGNIIFRCENGALIAGNCNDNVKALLVGNTPRLNGNCRTVHSRFSVHMF